MKIEEILTEMYTAYVLDDDSREMLMKKYPPKYEKVLAHHITVKFGVSKDTPPPPEADLTVIGYADSKDGLEALVVSINGKYKRPDGNVYHITWSLDPEKYAPKDSNDLIGYGKFQLKLKTPISVTPSVED